MVCIYINLPWGTKWHTYKYISSISILVFTFSVAEEVLAMLSRFLVSVEAVWVLNEQLPVALKVFSMVSTQSSLLLPMFSVYRDLTTFEVRFVGTKYPFLLYITSDLMVYSYGMFLLEKNVGNGQGNLFVEKNHLKHIKDKLKGQRMYYAVKGQLFILFVLRSLLYMILMKIYCYSLFFKYIYTKF